MAAVRDTSNTRRRRDSTCCRRRWPARSAVWYRLQPEAPTNSAAIDRPFEEHPYPPGWLDRTIDWIHRMPGTKGLYSLALLVVQLAWVTGLLWAWRQDAVRL